MSLAGRGSFEGFLVWDRGLRVKWEGQKERMKERKKKKIWESVRRFNDSVENASAEGKRRTRATATRVADEADELREQSVTSTSPFSHPLSSSSFILFSNLQGKNLAGEYVVREPSGYGHVKTVR